VKGKNQAGEAGEKHKCSETEGDKSNRKPKRGTIIRGGGDKKGKRGGGKESSGGPLIVIYEGGAKNVRKARKTVLQTFVYEENKKGRAGIKFSTEKKTQLELGRRLCPMKDWKDKLPG